MPTPNLYYYCHILIFTGFKAANKGRQAIIISSLQLLINEKHWFNF
jgi:hypothetical protein